jgi:hypothetical protein
MSRQIWFQNRQNIEKIGTLSVHGPAIGMVHQI